MIDTSIYDAMFVRNIDNNIPNVLELDPETSIPLMLKSEPQIGYSVVLASPISQIPEGAPKDSALGTWSAYSQETWDAGNLEKYAPDNSKRSYFSIADTRYPNRATLPPKVYGPFAIEDKSIVGSPITIGEKETIKTRWVTYREMMYVLAGGKLFRSVMDETSIVDGVITPNWKHAHTGTSTLSATDIDLFLQSGTWKLLTATPSGICVTNPITGVYESNPAQSARLVKVTGDTTVTLISENKFGSGTSLTSPVELVTGDTTLRINGYARIGDIAYLLTNKGIYTAFAATGKMVVPFGEYASVDAGSVFAIWNGKLYVALDNTLQSWDAQTVNMALCGLDKESGLPDYIATKITWLESSTTTLYAATNEAGKKSAIFAMTSENVWHCLYLSENNTDTISSLGVDTRSGIPSGGGLDSIIVAQPRLWFAINNKTYYMYVGKNDNQKVFTNSSGLSVPRGFKSQGEIISSLWTGKYTAVPKTFLSATVMLEQDVDNATVDVDIEVDNSGVWTPLKKITDCRRIEYVTTTPTWSKAKITDSATNKSFYCDSNSIKAGDCIRIGVTVSQVKSVSDSGEIILSKCLTAVPAIGTTIYSSRLVGNEFRTRMRLSSAVSNQTPVVRRLTVDFSHRILMRARHVIHVLVSDGLADRNGGRYPFTSKQISNALRIWASKEPFWMLTPDGDWRLVKIVNHSQAQYVWPDSNKQRRSPQSVATITLIEVD